jgi:hypothetical protein
LKNFQHSSYVPFFFAFCEAREIVAKAKRRAKPICSNITGNTGERLNAKGFRRRRNGYGETGERLK